MTTDTKHPSTGSHSPQQAAFLCVANSCETPAVFETPEHAGELCFQFLSKRATSPTQVLSSSASVHVPTLSDQSQEAQHTTSTASPPPEGGYKYHFLTHSTEVVFPRTKLNVLTDVAVLWFSCISSHCSLHTVTKATGSRTPHFCYTLSLSCLGTTGSPT